MSLLLVAEAAAAGRLDKIRASGAITLGHPETSIPFAYLDANQKPVGYTVDICRAIAAALQQRLALPSLDIRYNPVTSATRIPLIANGTIDLECGNTSNLSERHKFVDFAPTTYVTHTVLFARKDSGVDVNDIASLRGKTVTAQAGSLTIRYLGQLNVERKLNMAVMPANDLAQMLLMVQNGRVSAAATDDALAYANVASSPDPAIYVIGTTGLDLYPYGIVLPKGDEAFKQAVDDIVVDLIKQGKVAQLYERYFNSPIPPRNINLHYPMSEGLKKALANPTDSSDPAAYR
nr:amino acid ABC transporter substrate-binding protein [Achromobacter sp. DH1f]